MDTAEYMRRHPVVMARCFVAAAAGTCAATATTWMQPLMFQYYVAERGFNEAAAGLLLTIELGAMAITAVLMARFAPREHAQRFALAGVALSAACSFATMYLDSYPALALARALVGFGFGATIMVSNIVAANFPDPEKVFARIGLVNLALGALIVAAYPYLTAAWPTASPFTMLFLVTVILYPFIAGLPDLKAFDRAAEAWPEDAGPAYDRQLGMRTLLLAAVTFLVVMGSGIVWSLYAIIGARAGLSEGLINSAIALSIFTAVFGTMLPALFGNRFGRIAPFSIAMLLMAAAILVLTSGPGAFAFRIAVCINVATIYFVMPYMSGTAVALDGGGKAAAYVGSAFFFATAVSPLIGGIVIATVGIGFIGLMMTVLTLIVIAAFIHVNRSMSFRLAEGATPSTSTL